MNVKETTKTPTVTTPIDPDRTPVAADIWCYSNREKTFTWHVVINHDAKGFVDRVQCKVSGSIHKYKRQNKAEPVAKTRGRKAGGTSAAAKAARSEESWFDAIKLWGDKNVRGYIPATHFRVGEVIQHPTFGKGVIQGRRENKIDILFQTGMKILLSP